MMPLEKKSPIESYKVLIFRTLLLCTLLFTAPPLPARTESISTDLDHLLGRRYYVIQQAENNVDIIIFPRFNTDLHGNIEIEKIPAKTADFIEQQLEKKYQKVVTIKNPGYVPPYMIDEAVRKKQMKIFLISALCGTFFLFAGFIILRSLKLRVGKKI